METRSNHILVGSVVLALLAAVIVFIIWISQAGGNQDKRYDIFFSQAVDGLAKGSAVTFSGVPKGQVESINLQPQTPELVRVRIAGGKPVSYEDFVTGWQDASGDRWGRPVDVLVNRDGSVLISDDSGNAIYRVHR